MKKDKYTGNIVRVGKNDYRDKTEVVSNVKGAVVNCRTARDKYLKN